jgi:putative endonuclease
MKEFNLSTGKIGEEIAKEFLKNKGYEIIEQNYRTKYAEIDLLTKKDKEIILVEVRTKVGENFGSPEDSLTKKKLKKLWFNAQLVRATRIDAVCIVLNQVTHKPERIEHYESIM